VLTFSTEPADAPDRQTIEIIATLLRSGEVAILPTDTLYGLHCSAMSEGGVEKIFALKERERGKPLLVLAASIEQAKDELGAIIDQRDERVLRAVWPAPLTAVLRLKKALPASAGSATLAVRIPQLDWLRELIQISGPVTSTSVNVSGEPALYTMSELSEKVKNGVAAIIDCGPLQGEPSTLVDFTGELPIVLREGAFRFSQDLWKTSRKSL
jgi:tRNA threonylcarbamoyl adenosine modification protein (Sua5/YciO/YrdC/YwlC family)